MSVMRDTTTMSFPYKTLGYYAYIVGKKNKIDMLYNFLSSQERIRKMNHGELYDFLNKRFRIYVLGRKRKIVELKFFATLDSDKNKRYIFSIKKEYHSDRDIEYMKELKEDLIKYIINRMKANN